MKYDVFLICPVRHASIEQKARIAAYIEILVYIGKKVYYPARDTNQNDKIGYGICEGNKQAMEESKEVHIFWDSDSKGSLFDLGMAFAMNKPLKIVPPLPNRTEGKSFENMIIFWSQK